MTLPSSPSTSFPYLTRVPGRNRLEKLHTNLGAAKNAINGTRGPGKIYKWVDGDWTLLYDETGYPYSWQVKPLADKKAKEEAAIEENRARYINEKAIPEAKAALEKQDHPTPDEYSFISGYTAALMRSWDAQNPRTKAMYYFGK